MAIDKKKTNEELIVEAKSFFETYKKEIGESIRKGRKVVYVNFEDLASSSPLLAEALIGNPNEILQILETALEETGLIKNPRIRFNSLPETQKVKIRTIRAHHLNQLIFFEGIIRQASDVRPQVVNAKFECPSCGTVISVLQIEKKFREPTRCSCGRKGQFRLLSKTMVDAQRLVIEESSEALSGGEQPRRMTVFLKEDLVEPLMEEKTTPGSKARVIGILNEVPLPLPTGSISTRFDLAIEANNLIPLETTYEDLDISEEDERQIEEISTDPELFKKLRESIAPSIWGYEEIKEALVLQMFGGVRKISPDGTVSRGDMHVFLIGDPGVAKSQVLKFVSTIAPRGRYIVGKSTSGAGITATVVKDEFLKGWALEAGAMVLANNGIVCIDEIEKMDPQDRSAMHEALEQQCYLPDLELTLSDGSKVNIGNLIDELMEKNKDNVKEGFNCQILDLNKKINILTTDFESIYHVNINKVSRHIAPNSFIKIMLSNGRNVIVTPKHPCWIVKNGKITTIPAKDLKENDFFPIPGELPIEGEEQIINSEYKNGPELCKILGYHITDGCYELNRGIKNGIQFWNNDKKLIEDYSSSIKNYFDINPGLTKRNNQFAVRVVSKKVVDFLNNLDKNLMEKGILKKIPEKIIKCKNKDIAFLLRALFDGDGTVVNVKRGGYRISLITENIGLAEQVSELLLRFGILSSIYNDREFFKLDICGEENLIKFFDNIGFLSEKKQLRLKNYIEKQKTYRSITDIIPNSTKTIKKIFKHLKINEEKYLGNQVCMNCNKHRLFLQKMINICEEKINKLMEAKEIVKNNENSSELKRGRILCEFSKLSISKKLGITDYMMEQNEKKGIANRKYKEILLNEIEEMLKIISDLRELKKLAFGKIRWSRIKSVKIIKNNNIKWVYDIMIDKTHSFISNNMVLHNSVTISKANVQASLSAKTSVLAAGNPKYGRFEPTQSITEQIDLPPTLLNRFDLIFILRDLPNKAQDDAIATHVLNIHQRKDKKPDITMDLFKKYVAYAKRKIEPKLTDEAVDEIKNFYVRLRNMQSTGDSRSIAISARQLQGLVRLAEAHAKSRLSPLVEKQDSEVAIRLTTYYLMQVGYDPETKKFDIDRFSTRISSSQRSKLILLRETIKKLEEVHGKQIPMEVLRQELGTNMSDAEFEETLMKLEKEGTIFHPKPGVIQEIGAGK